MENNFKLGCSALVVYIWMHHSLKNIRQNSTLFDSKSASHETFVIAKFIFRGSHEFVVSQRGQIAGTLSRYLCLICFRELLHGTRPVMVETLKLRLPLNDIWFLPPLAGLTGDFGDVRKWLFPSQASRSLAA